MMRNALGWARRLCCAALFLLAPAMAVSSAPIADPPPDYLYGLVIDSVRVDSAPTGGATILRVRIVNDAAEPLILLGAEAQSVGASRILARTQHAGRAVLDSITIPSEEMLDLGSNHLLIELSNLKRPFRKGETISLALSFLRGTVPIEAHVH